MYFIYIYKVALPLYAIDSKHGLGTINMSGTSEKNGAIVHAYLRITVTSQRPLSSVPKMAVVERFNCISSTICLVGKKFVTHGLRFLNLIQDSYEYLYLPACGGRCIRRAVLSSERSLYRNPVIDCQWYNASPLTTRRKPVAAFWGLLHVRTSGFLISAFPL